MVGMATSPESAIGCSDWDVELYLELVGKEDVGAGKEERQGKAVVLALLLLSHIGMHGGRLEKLTSEEPLWSPCNVTFA